MKRPKTPPREKKNSKYKIDEALRYANKNNNVIINIIVSDIKTTSLVYDYIEQKKDKYNFQKQQDYNDNSYQFINKETNSQVIINDTSKTPTAVELLDLIAYYIDKVPEQKRYVIIDKRCNIPVINKELYVLDKFGIPTTIKPNLIAERIDFKKFKFAKIDKQRLEELKKW